MEKTIMYIDVQFSTLTAVGECCKELGKPWDFLSYFEELKQRTPERWRIPGVQSDDVLDVVEQVNPDLLVMDGRLDYKLGVSKQIRGKGLRTKTMVLPIYWLGPGATEESSLAADGADFGRGMSGLDETVRAIENIFANRTGGYVFNPNLYEDRNGILIPKG